MALDPAADPARAALQPLVVEVLKLRAAKWTYVRISVELGISATAVSSISKVPITPPPPAAQAVMRSIVTGARVIVDAKKGTGS